MTSLENFSLQKEEEIREYWKKNKVQEKARKQSAKQKKYFYFMDGPPYATGHIHMGTALNKILKDTAMRFKRMKGFNVFDRPGYDTHGTPIEFQVEKEIGTKNKQDIQKFGVENFIKKCRAYATEFIDKQNSEFENLGVWMDWNNPYITLKNEYIESIWWAFKKAEEIAPVTPIQSDKGTRKQALRDLMEITGNKAFIAATEDGTFAGEGLLNLDKNGNVILTRFSNDEYGLTKEKGKRQF